MRGRARLSGIIGRARGRLPLPPLELRQMVGPIEDRHYDNPDGSVVFPNIDEAAYEAVLDFGCGCGRVARQLIQQHERPRRYLGIDLNKSAIDWCTANLAPHAPGFTFEHHDVFNAVFNPDRSRPDALPFPAPDASFSLVIAHSVFTHLTEEQTVHYLRECARVLRPDGILRATWFLLDKREFAFMQPVHHALYLSHVDPSAAVVFDRGWMREAAADAGLTIVEATPPALRGFHWVILMTSTRDGVEEIELPGDDAPLAPAQP